MLGPKARVQAPPNLVELGECRLLLGRRHRRLGRRLAAHPRPREPRAPLAVARAAARVTAEAGLELRPRLTVHPEYVVAGEPWLDPRVLPATWRRWRRPTAWPDPAYDPSACPGRSPTAALAHAELGRTDLHTAVDTEGRTADRRSDFDTVYGDWDSLREDSPTVSAVSSSEKRPNRAASREAAGRAACAAAERDPAGLTDEQALTLITAEGELLEQVCRLADDLRRDVVGDEVTYVVNRNINFTNVCYVGCRFCAFAQRRTDADAYSLSLDEVADRAAGGLGARRDRGVHAGRHRPGAARDGVLRPGRRREAPGAGHARARVLARWRSSTAPAAPGCPSRTS